MAVAAHRAAGPAFGAAAQGSSGTAATARSAHYWTAPLTIFVSLLPLQFELATLVLTPLRILLLVLTPYLAIRWLMGAFGKPVYADFAIISFCTFLALSLAHNHGFGRMVTFAGSNGMLIFGGYMVGRAAIRSAADFRGLVRFLALMVLLLMPFAAYETLMIQPPPIIEWTVEKDWLIPYSGHSVELRFGLNRAQVVFTHRIHFGIFCSLAFATYFLSLRNYYSASHRAWVTTLIALTAAASLSSGPFASLLVQLMMVCYVVWFHAKPWQWTYFKWGGIATWLVLEVSTTKVAFFRLAEMVAYSKWNAYTRQIMIDTAIDLMKAYPLFGYGLGRWPLPFWMKFQSSIDNYWAVLGGAYGIPALVSAMSAFLWPMLTAGGFQKLRFRKGSDLYWVRVSWAIMALGTIVVLGTVHLWGNLTTPVYLMLGAGMFLMRAEEPQNDGHAQEARSGDAGGRLRPRYTRFPGGNTAIGGGRHGGAPARGGLPARGGPQRGGVMARTEADEATGARSDSATADAAPSRGRSVREGTRQRGAYGSVTRATPGLRRPTKPIRP